MNPDRYNKRPRAPSSSPKSTPKKQKTGKKGKSQNKSSSSPSSTPSSSQKKGKTSSQDSQLPAQVQLQAQINNYNVQLVSPTLSVLQVFNSTSLKTPISTPDPLCVWASQEEGVLFHSQRNSDAFWLDKAGLNDILFQHLFETTNERRKQRLELQKSPKDLTNTSEDYQFNRKKYIKKLSKEISIERIKCYISCILMMGIRKFTSCSSYFLLSDERDPRGCEFVTSRITHWEFYFISSCIDFEIDWISSHLRKSTTAFYSHTSFVASDETMTPSKSKANPHHHFVPGKPHPNGVLSTSCGDSNKVILSLKTRRRTVDDFDPLLRRNKEESRFDRLNFEKPDRSSMKELIVDLFHYKRGTKVVIDRLYGGLEVVSDLAEKKVYCLAKCKANRPSFLFKQFLHKIIRLEPITVGRSVVAYGSFSFPSGKVPFYAFTIVTEVKDEKNATFDNFISTFHDEKAIGVFDIESQEVEGKDQTTTSKKAVFSPGSIIKEYNSNSGFIDQINDQLIQSFPSFKFMRWKTKHLFTFIFSFINNARRFKILSENNKNIESIIWRIRVANLLSPLPEVPQTHDLCGIPGGRQKCKVCYTLKDKKETKTKYYCSGCQASICDICFHSPKHTEYSNSDHGKFSKQRAKFL